MQHIHHRIVIRGERARGGRIDSRGAGLVIHHLPEHAQRAASMVFRGRSRMEGRRPGWLDRVADIRLVAVDGNAGDETVLHFEVPTFGSAAEELYRQTELWDSRPDPTWTCFEAYADVLRDIGAQNEDSDRFDRSFLRAFREFRQPLCRFFDEVDVEDRRGGPVARASLTIAVIVAADRLGAHVPAPRPVRIVGLLDMLRGSTQSFALRLDDGAEVRGTLSDGDIASIAHFFKKRVLVVGKAVYRPSGKLLRIDADAIVDGTGEASIWSKVPRPVITGPRHEDYRKPQTEKTNVRAVLGKIEADEDEETFLQMLEEMS